MNSVHSGDNYDHNVIAEISQQQPASVALSLYCIRTPDDGVTTGLVGRRA
ncbi:MAG: hypothetical protein QNI91_14450 [Arenicellales bacterium]|nr:hypothetical protein [Arenicellales bacterium]